MRFFISSTFQDLESERNILTDEIFPKLRKQAEERGVPFSWCDLRWGVSCFEDENILRICLKNIRECSPYIIGLIGRRYGSVPSNLNRKRVKQLNNSFKGVRRILNRYFSFTEIEIRYFLMLNKTKDHNGFFFCLDSNEQEKYPSLVRYIIQSFLFQQCRSEIQKINNLKRYIEKKQITHSIKEDKYAFSATVYQIMSNAICSLPIPDDPYQEIIYAENQKYLNDICSNYFPLEDCQSHYQINQFLLDDKAKNDILIVGGDKGVGKTYITSKTVYEYCRKSECVFLFFFLGKSRSDDTQIQILSNLVYQATKHRISNRSCPTSFDSINSERDYLFEILTNTDKNIVILIDGISTNNSLIYDESFYSITSWIPDKVNRVKYVLTTDLSFPLNPRMNCLHISDTTNTISSFIVKYWKRYYSSSGKNLSPLLAVESGNFLCSKLNAKIVIDEYVCGNYENCKDLIEFTYSTIYRRLCFDLFENTKIDQSYLPGIRVALNYLLMSKYGLQEKDIRRLCSIEKEWTILYYYVYPFLDSYGKIKLLPGFISSSTCEFHEADRLDFVDSLIRHNANNIYTKEILYQLSFVGGNKFLDFLSKGDTFNYLYCTDNWLLHKYIKEIDRNGQIEDFLCLLKTNSCELNDEILVLLYCNAAIFFTKSYLKIKVAEFFINETFSQLKHISVNNDLWIQCSLSLVHINIYKGNIHEALIEFQKIESRFDKYKYEKLEYYRMQFEKATIFDNYYTPHSYRKNAAEIYYSIINNISPQEDIELCLLTSYKYLFLLEIEKQHEIAAQFVTNYKLIQVGSRSFYKFYAKNIYCELLLKRYGSNISSILLDNALLKFDEILNQAESLGYYNELYQCLFDIIDVFNAILPRSKDSLLQKYSQRLSDVVLRYFDSHSIENALLLQHKIKLLADDVDSKIENSLFRNGNTLKLTNRDAVEKAILYHDELIGLYSEIGIDIKSTRTYSRLLHNLALIYLSCSEFEKAITVIEESINRKRYLLLESDKSIFRSEYRKLVILFAKCLHYKDSGLKLTDQTPCITKFESYLDEITNKCSQLKDLPIEEIEYRIQKFTSIKRCLSKVISSAK